MTEKLDLGRLAKLAVVHRKEGTPFVSVTPDEIDSLIARIRALESRASNAGRAVYQALHVDTCTWEDVTAEYYTERLPSNRRILYTHPAPASKEPVADERCDGCGGEIGDAFCAVCLVDSVEVWLRGIKEDGYRTDNERCAAEILLKLAIEPRAALATAQTAHAEFQVWEGGMQVASTLGQRNQALHEAERYFHQYKDDATDDSPVELLEIIRLAAAPAKPEGVS